MNLDRFSQGVPDRQEKELEEFSTCYGCREPIYYGEEYLLIFETCVHDDYSCIRKSVGASLRVAEKNENY